MVNNTQLSTPKPKARKITTGVIVVHGKPTNRDKPKPKPQDNNTETIATNAIYKKERKNGIPKIIDTFHESSCNPIINRIITNTILITIFVIVCKVPLSTSFDKP